MRAVESSPTPAQTLLFPENEHLRGSLLGVNYYGISTGTGEKYEGTRIQQTFIVEADPPSSPLTRLIWV